MTSVVESQKKYRVNFASTSTKSDRQLANVMHLSLPFYFMVKTVRPSRFFFFAGTMILTR